jgi:gamma-glutamyltranspeptidase/glutathione hydrolase
VTAGLLAALEKYGTMPRQRLLSRPIQLAREGYAFSGYEEAAAMERWESMNDELKRVLGCDAIGKQAGELAKAVPGAPCPVGTKLRQPSLARTLEAISQHGAAGFYQGVVAKKLVAGLRASGGIMTETDLRSYQPKWRDVVSAKFRGMEVVSMPPPSAGGVVLLQMLGYAERADAQGAFADGFGSARALHAIAHGMALGFADRAKHFGDPDHWKVPVAGMLDPAYLDSRWKSFDPSKAALPDAAGEPAREGTHTTHFSVVDRNGNMVVITTTINDNYGSGFMPAGTGVVMNNEMDDFSIEPGVHNLFGLVGAEANAIAPGKRPLSSMTPTIVRDAQGNNRIGIGAAGGPRITTSVYLSLLNRLRFGMSLVDAVAAPRVHQQWKPAKLRLERYGFSTDTRQKLLDLGYELEYGPALARGHAVERFPNGRTWGVPDFRAEGAAVAE